MFSDLPWLSAIIYAIIAMVIGMIWYNPKVFGSTWAKSIGKDPAAMMSDKPGPATMVVALVSNIVLFFALAALVSYGAADSLADHLKIALLIWLGFFVTNQIGAILWAKYKPSFLFVNGGYDLLMLLVGGTLLYLL